ncbi:hypothetical protein MSG28_009385 [Choristoneura fumiferana]|uniref:Uncharacterized protein n=1 Tax=Choristoneura fumiferana TaxID=7141 RepID=A0ACC0KXD5_CHOFU|nr:hypothetical protein MSG28_009385 [Choristoneura fumiferana]
MTHDELLIDLVSQHEVIYNVKSEEYRDAGLRSAAWEEISKRYGKPVEDCKEDWNKLRNCFNNAVKRRLIKTNKTGKRMHPWRYEAQMAFLLPHMQGRINDHNHEEILENPPSPQNVLKYSPTPSCSSPPIKRRTISVTDCMDPLQYANVMETLEAAHAHPDIDDTDHFFLSMSKMAKKLPKMDRIRIQMDLHKAIYEAEMKHLEANSKEYKKVRT